MIESKIKLLYSRKEAAVSLSISVRTLDKYIAAGKLRTRKFEGRVLLPLKELERFAAEDQLLETPIHRKKPVVKATFAVPRRWRNG
jgi:excisionase family DNA binding protein